MKEDLKPGIPWAIYAKSVLEEGSVRISSAMIKQQGQA